MKIILYRKTIGFLHKGINKRKGELIVLKVWSIICGAFLTCWLGSWLDSNVMRKMWIRLYNWW